MTPLSDDHPDSVSCPECDARVSMGLPRSAEVEAVTTTPDETLEGEFLDTPRHKRRRNRCSSDHVFYVYFSY